MESAIKAPGIPATFEPVDWNPPGLPTDPAEVMACLVDPERRGEVYPLYHQLRRLAPMYKNRPEVLHGALAITRFSDADVLFRNARVVNDPAESALRVNALVARTEEVVAALTVASRPAPGLPEIGALLLEHLEGLYDLYGEEQGARVARKHIGWTVRELPGGEPFRRAANLIVDAEAQLRAVKAYFDTLAANEEMFLEKHAA